MKNRLMSLVLTMLFVAGCQKDDGSSASSPQVKSFGHEQGNATDNPPSGFGGAWMLGEENVVNYCLVVSPDFGADTMTVIDTFFSKNIQNLFNYT